MYLTGLSGSGKSTIGRLAASIIEGEARHVEFSELLAREFSERAENWNIITDGAFMAAGERAALTLLTDLPAIVTGHVFAHRPRGRLVLEHAWNSILPCVSVVMLDVTPQELAVRAVSRGSLIPVERFTEDRLFAINYATSKCVETGSPFVLLQNEAVSAINANADFVANLMRGGYDKRS